MDRLGKIVIVFSLVGVCILYGISLLLNPPFVSLDEVASYETMLIRTRGAITEFRITESSYVLMTIEGNQTELLVFVDSAVENLELLNLSYGDEIEVEGKVQVYQGDYELVSSGNAIKKVKQGGSVAFVSQIAAHPEQYEGKRISVVGYVDDVYTYVFYLCDEPGTYRMRVTREGDAIAISELHEGDKVTAEGVFAYDAKNLRYELHLLALKSGE